MNIQEFKLRMVNGINSLIDDYFGSMTGADRIINSTLKIIVKQNTHKLDNILNLFADEHGDINMDIIIEEYSNAIGDSGFIFDLRDMVNNDIVKSILPNKALVIKKGDLRKLFDYADD